MLVTEAGKHVVHRTLEGQLALPSGHTTGVTSVSLVVAFVLVRATNRQTRAACTAALGAVTLAALAMGAVMVLLRFHYPTDIAAGWAAAVACTLGSALVIDRVAGDRRSRELATG
jgi:membrane-associated phospholipid phosphatase